MKFDFKCDETDALVIIDEEYLSEINDDILYALDIFLDKDGKSELVYDFPDEKWNDVYERETAKLIEFCSFNKMFLVLMDNDVLGCEINIYKESYESNKKLNIPSGKVLIINASELIQCLTYPDLEMEKILELEIEKGIYTVTNDSIKHINLFNNQSL